YESFVHGLGVGYKGKVEMARAFTLVWSGEGIKTFTATGDRPIQKNEPTLFEIWVCVDGYWTDLTKNACPGELKPEYHKLLDLLLKVFNEAVSFSRDGASFPELDKLVRARIAEGGYPGQPSHPVCHGVGARDPCRNSRRRNRRDGVRCDQHSQPNWRRAADGAVHEQCAKAARA